MESDVILEAGSEEAKELFEGMDPVERVKVEYAIKSANDPYYFREWTGGVHPTIQDENQEAFQRYLTGRAEAKAAFELLERPVTPTDLTYSGEVTRKTPLQEKEAQVKEVLFPSEPDHLAEAERLKEVLRQAEEEAKERTLREVEDAGEDYLKQAEDQAKAQLFGGDPEKPQAGVACLEKQVKQAIFGSESK